jgi:hypothetical protein
VPAYPERRPGGIPSTGEGLLSRGSAKTR